MPQKYFHFNFNLQKWFEPVELNSPYKSRILIWLAVSLAVACYFGSVTFLYVSSHEYIVQDDMRQHVVWLQQWIDPQLFPNDQIANYFKSVAPLGFKWFYGMAAQLGIEPLVLAKILPLILSCITTIYLFFVSLHVFPVPLSAFLGTLILNQHLWLNDDLTSATPRAFVYPIFTAFLYYLINRKLVLCLITIAVQGLFFPQLVFVQVLILSFQILRYQQNSWRLSKQRQDYIFWLGGTCVAGLVLLLFALKLSEFGSVITAAQMRTMPEYGLAGRNEYFGVNPLRFIFMGDSGLRIPLFPSIILAGFGLPFLKRRFPFAGTITIHAKILIQITLASLLMYGAAHLLLMKLHFPNRYTYHTFRIVLAIAAGIVLTVLLEAGWRRWQESRLHGLSFRARALLGLTIACLLMVLIIPAVPQLFLRFQGWVTGDAAVIYEYLANQPKDILVASLASDANNLPAFSQRSILVGREFSLPHHPQYYAQFRQRVADSLLAQYSEDPAIVMQMIVRYGIDFFLVERSAFQPDYLQQDWLIRSSFQEDVLQIIQRLEQKPPEKHHPFVMQQWMQQCEVVSTKTLILVKTPCFTDSVNPAFAPNSDDRVPASEPLHRQVANRQNTVIPAPRRF